MLLVASCSCPKGSETVCCRPTRRSVDAARTSTALSPIGIRAVGGVASSLLPMWRAGEKRKGWKGKGAVKANKAVQYPVGCGEFTQS